VVSASLRKIARPVLLPIDIEWTDRFLVKRFTKTVYKKLSFAEGNERDGSQDAKPEGRRIGGRRFGDDDIAVLER
jgi:hypothetical protein